MFANKDFRIPKKILVEEIEDESVGEQSSQNLQSVPVENMILCGPPSSFTQDVNFEESASYELFHPPPNQSRLIHEKNSTTASENYVDSVEEGLKEDNCSQGRIHPVELYGRNDENVTVNNGSKLDLNALPFVSRDHAVEDAEDLMSYVSSHRLNQSFNFVAVDRNPNITHAAQLYPAGPHVLVSVDNLRDLIRHFRFFTIDQLLALADGHRCSFASSSKKISKSSIQTYLSTHECDGECSKLKHVFKMTLKDRRTVRFNDNADEHVADQSAIGSMTQPEKNKTRTGAGDGCHDHVHEDKSPESSEHRAANDPFPSLCGNARRRSIIDEWQAEMDLDRWTISACAVCAQRISKKDIRVVSADDVDFNLLQNPCLPAETLPTSYNLDAYGGAILYAKGLHDKQSFGPLNMCRSCECALVEHREQPKNSLANWHYTGHEALPADVYQAFKDASLFDLMMVARCRATRITQLFSSKKGSPSYGECPSESQRYNKGNVSVIPQDSIAVRPLLPPDSSEIQTAVTALFTGGTERPTAKNIGKLSPVLVSKNRVQIMLDFLLSKNMWYQTSGVAFSEDNFKNLHSDEDKQTDEALLKAVELCWLPPDDAKQLETGNSDYTNREDAEADDGEDDDNNERDILMESVGYTSGDRSPQNYKMMKASALAWCLSRKKFIKMQGGSRLLSDRDPAMMTYLFPHLDPWGIAGFYQSERRESQYVSFERQVKNLLLQDESPFQADHNFAFVCWNIIQKREVSKTASFRTKIENQKHILSELTAIGPAIPDLISKWETDPHAQASNRQEKRAMNLLNRLKLVAKELRGSSGYKLCRRNEIRALMKKFGTPALFVTLNPSDVNHPLLGVLGGKQAEEWRNMSKHERMVFVARHPGPAAQFFDVMMKAFINIIVRHGREDDGLFGSCETYYGMVEAQGRGTLHCHMLLWIKGNPSPQALRERMVNESGFRPRMFDWIESVIQCQLPEMTEVLDEPAGPLRRPRLGRGQIDPRMKEFPRMADMSEEEFACRFRSFVTELAERCNWHEHKDTCWKHLKSGAKIGDPVCRMRINGHTRAFTDLDDETQSILLKRLHPRINNFNDVVIFLMQCNMDIKYIGSGEAAKALVYYVTDYITKDSLATHVGLGALAYAIRQNDAKYEDDIEPRESEKAKSIFVKTVNAMMARQELSHPQVMSYLIGGGDHYKANTFRLLKWAEVDRFIRKDLNEPPWSRHINKNGFDSEARCAFRENTDEVTERSSNGMDVDGLEDDSDAAYSDELTLQVENDKLIPTNTIQDYCHRPRGEEYTQLSLWEHTEWVCKITKKSEQTRARKQSDQLHPVTRSTRVKKPVGRKPNVRGDFSSQRHPNFTTHTNRLRDVPFVPVLLGEALPRCDRAEEEREQWCRAMLILFKPWRKPKDLKSKNESWSDAFSKHSFNDDVMNIINNMNVENECKDARNTYNRKLRNGEFNDPLLQGFVVNTSPADMSSLGTAILNDCRFDRNNDQDDDHYNNIANERSTLEPNGPAEQLVALATQTGLFKTQGEVDTGYVVPGSASFVTDNEKEILKMQRALMEEMRRDKRPAPSQLLNETPRSNRHKNNESDPSTDLSELESSAEFVDVCNRADAPFSPEDALQSIIEEFNMKDNEQQLRAVRIVGEHFISGTEEQLLCHVSGAGGTGKTHVIHAIVEFFKRCGASEKLMLSASTGCAAVLISGYTLHALTFLGPHKTKSKQDQLERIWKNIKYLIVDEISMISAHFLHQVSERISKAKAWDPSVIDKPFGGVHMIFTGDIGQLPPVNAASLFSHTLVSKLSANISQTTRGQEALNGAFLWRQLNKVIELKKNVRAQSDEMFTNLLLRIREGRAWNGLKPPSHWQAESTKKYEISDYEVLLSRRLQLLLKKDPDALRKFKDAPIVVGEKVLRDALNSKLVDSFATKTGQQVHCYHADDRYRKTALESVLRKRMLRAQSNITDDSIGMLPLVPGMKVMITDNVAMRGGVANGCQGTLRDVKYEMNEYGERRAICAYVHVPGTNVQAPGLPPDVVPILPERNSFKYKDVNGTEYMISRSQLPLLPAYAFTANKIQGQSLKYAIVDLRSAHGTQALYVMISRAVCLDNLAVLRWFPSTNLDRRLSEAYRNEFDRLRTLDRRTIDEYHKRKWRPAKHRAPKSHF